LQEAISSRLKQFIKQPQVNVTVTQIRSQPVSVLGAVSTPGVQQLRGRQTLMEMLSVAGGLRPDAGSTVTITRHVDQGELPLPMVARDASGKFWVAEVNLESVMSGEHPEYNAMILPHDIISVQRVKMIYVVGAVTRAGAFPLNEKENLSILKAVSMAGGVTGTAATGDVRIIRDKDDPAKRTEVTVDLKKILAGRSKDLPLAPDDVLFVPDSRAKRIATRTLEAALNTVGGILIFRSSAR
jgi:polysaccharide export outer membrane protein